MQFIYIRHGEPIYDPDDLTDLGRKQADEVAHYLSQIGVDQIYSSTSNRAIQTAIPTAKKINKDITYVDFASEVHVWKNLTIDTPTGKRWLFQSIEMKELFHNQGIINLGSRWYDHPAFINTTFKAEMNRIQEENDRFFAALGYQHLGNGKYKVVHETNQKVVLFAHQGFGLAFLSLLLGIPYPQFCTHFDLGHAEVSIIDFKNENGYSYPKMVTFANDGHLIKHKKKI